MKETNESCEPFRDHESDGRSREKKPNGTCSFACGFRDFAKSGNGLELKRGCAFEGCLLAVENRAPLLRLREKDRLSSCCSIGGAKREREERDVDHRGLPSGLKDVVRQPSALNSFGH